MMEKVTLWVDTIRNHQVVLTNGELKLNFEIVAPDDTGSNLPEIFRKATISDQFDVQIEISDDE